MGLPLEQVNSIQIIKEAGNYPNLLSLMKSITKAEKP